MKKNYLIAVLVLAFQFANAQLEQVAYRGAFAPTGDQWIKDWTNWNPNNEDYTDASSVVTVSSNITSNTTWTAGKTYKLNGTIYVTNNAILTIQPGVVVKGIYSNTGTALVITKGAKLNAIGTAAAPIVFTSAKAKGARAAGDWGGIILLGKSTFNQTGGLNNIEGLPANSNTEYGGGSTPDTHDNSGTLKYVRIEYGGFVFSPNNEINGLTFGAVGDGTTIDNVQVSFSGDDSFEWFGGNVNCKHLVAYRGLDDDLDTDNGYAGTVQFALCIRDPQIADNPAISTSEGFESDNNPGDVEPIAAPNNVNTSAIFSNCTMVGPSFRNTGTLASGYARALRLRRRTELKVINTIFLDWNNNYAGLTDDTTIAKYIAGKLILKSNIFAGLKSADQTSYPESINPRTKAVNVTINGLLTTPYTLPYTFDLGAQMTADHNSVVTSSADIVTKAYNTDKSDYTGLDYRPGTLAATGADFTGDRIAPFVTGSTDALTTNETISYCKGDVATALTATGSSLKWYKATTLTGKQTLLTAAPTPLTTAAGTQYFFVSNSLTTKTITVTVNALPTDTFAGIYNITTDSASTTSVATLAISSYVGTTTEFTFKVPALAEGLKYKWSVPNGVTIKAGGTDTSNTITVNFANVTPDFVGKVGSISVQAQNASGCLGTAKAIALTTALPAAPGAIKVTNGDSTTAITNYGKYAGTTTPLTLTATASATATSYVWSLPAGVNVILTGSPVTTTKDYYAYPFTGTGGAGNTSAGAHVWTVTKKVYTNLDNSTITITTAKQVIKSGNTINSFLPYGTVITSSSNAILVNFSGVSSAKTTLYIGVKAKNGAGISVTSNVADVNAVAALVASTDAVPAHFTPSTESITSISGLFDVTYTETYTAPANAVGTSPYSGVGEHAAVVSSSYWNATGYALSTAKLLKLTAAAPAKPAAVKLTIGSSATAVTVLSKYVGTSTVLTLTATASPNAVSYVWTLPAYATQLSGGTTNVITVDLHNATSSATSIAFSAKAVNVFGNSDTTTLTCTAAKPAAVAKVVNFGLTTLADAVTIPTSSSTTSKVYTIAASPLANTYVITVPTGCTVTSASNTETPTTTLETADLDFTVVYPAGYVSTTATPKKLSIVAKNGIGTSVEKLYTIKSSAAVNGRIASEKGAESLVVSTTEVYPNPANNEFAIDITASQAGTLEIAIYSFDGNMAVSPRSVQLHEGNNTFNETISSLRKGIYVVQLINSSTGEVITKKLIKG